VLANASTNLNTPSTIVRRDSSGNFLAGLITTATGVVFPNGGTTLNYYFAGSATPTFSANTGTPSTLTPTVLYSRIGNIVTVTVAAQSFTASGSPQFYTALAAIPLALRPTQGEVQTVLTPLVGLNLYDPTNVGTAIVNAAGNIIISRDANHIVPWISLANQGWDSVTITYCV
jgi:hypothetical protein